MEQTNTKHLQKKQNINKYLKLEKLYLEILKSKWTNKVVYLYRKKKYTKTYVRLTAQLETALKKTKIENKNQWGMNNPTIQHFEMAEVMVLKVKEKRKEKRTTYSYQ